MLNQFLTVQLGYQTSNIGFLNQHFNI
jgi:hypothetical protein